MLLVCKLPTPPPGPENAFVALEFKSSTGRITKDTLTDSTGKKFSICLIHNLTQYVDSSILKITKGTTFNEVYTVKSFKGQVDTTYYPVLFSDTGIYAVSLTGSIQGKPTTFNGSITIVNRRPENAFVALEFKSSSETITKDTLTDSIGKKFNICLIHNLTQYIDSSIVRITKGTTLNEVYTIKSFKAQIDTIYYPMLFSDPGFYTVNFTGYMQGKPTILIGTITILGQQTTQNQKPVLTVSKEIMTGAGQELVIPVSATDPDTNQQVTITVTGKPESATFTDNLFKWTPGLADTGSVTVTFTATDNGLPVLSVTDSCVIVVSATPVNRAPQWSIKSIQRSALPEVLFSMDVSSYCIDPDNDNLTFSLLTQAPAEDTIAGNLYQFTPAVTDTGLHSISIVASDPAGLTDTFTLALTISTIIINTPDKVPPVITIRSPFKDTVVSVDSCEIEVTCVDDSGCSVKGYCDGIAFDMVKVPSVANLWSGMVKGLKTGINSTIKIIATDSSAAKNTDSVAVRIKYDGDTTKPALTRVTPSGESASTNVSNYTITVSCTDANGIASVVGTMGTQTFAGTKGTANVWTIAITGLSPTAVNAVTVTATDSSLRANKSTLPYSITYDPTGADNTPPHVYFTNPIKDTVIGVDSFTVTAVCVDPSRISSLVGKRDTTTFSMNRTTVDSIWTGVVKALPSGSFATIKLIATDDATARNKDSVTVRIKYDGDATKPVLTRVTPAGESASTNASSYTITVNCTDASGVASVVGTMGTQTFTGTKGAANAWTIAITGLSATAVNAVTVTATDSSLRANKSTLNYSITSDPTMLDTIGPTITDVSGPASGSTVTAAVVDIVKGISDPSGIDSVYWTKNGGAKKVMSPVTVNAGQYSLKDTLTEGRGDTLVITCVDKATKHNQTKLTIILKYSEPRYTVTYDGNGNTGGTLPVDAGSYVKGATVTVASIGTTVRSGYTFSGWNTLANGSGTSYTTTFAMGNSNVTLYAQWTINDYTITFNKNDAAATGSMANQSIKYNATAALSPNSYIKDGWSFNGWATSATGAVVYGDEDNYKIGASNVTLYAKWVSNPYTITFNKNDAAATGTMAAQTIASGSTAALSANTFVKSGWTFTGWATTSTGAVVYQNSVNYTMGTANVTLYAKWVVNNHIVTFNKNDAAATGSMSTQTIAENASVPLTTIGFEKPGYTFAGWATSANGTAIYTNQDLYTMGTADVTLYAKWNANLLTVTFNKNDLNATGTMANQSIYSGSTAALSANAFTKPGWTFAGWATSASGAKVYDNQGTFSMGTTNITLYAKWTANTYKVIFHSGRLNSSGSMTSQSILCDASANLNANAFTVPCMSFQGWATSSSGTVAYSNGQLFKMGPADVDLYAIWSNADVVLTPALGQTINHSTCAPITITTSVPSSCIAEYEWHLIWRAMDNLDLPITDGMGGYEGAGTPTLTQYLSDQDYYCIVTDMNGNKIKSGTWVIVNPCP
jgi:uncharacterized repeat protein (TIGR02543 family)